jgi:glutathione S-transferase
MLELYQFEHCPYCAKVRAALTELELDYVIRNVPKGSEKRSFLRALGGKEQVPFLVDQERNVMMYESDDIIAYVQEHYGKNV